jgi:hypothetical protein
MTDPAACPAQPAAPPGAGPASLAVPARTGVPVSIWTGLPAPPPCPASPHPVPCPRRFSAEAAAKVITAFCRPGGLVVIPEPGTGTLIAAAAAAGRQAVGLAASTRQHRALAARLDRDLGPAARHLARLRTGGPQQLLRAASPDTGRAALAITTACPAPGCPPPGDEDSDGDAGGSLGTDPGVLYAACQRALRPGGLLVIITSAAREPGCPAELISHARAAGLIYTQHIIAVHAPIRDSHLAVTAGVLSLPSGAAGPARNLPIHSDLLILARPGGPRP